MARIIAPTPTTSTTLIRPSGLAGLPDARLSRRRLALAVPAGLALLGTGTMRARAQDDDEEDEEQSVPIVSTRTGDLPSTGGARPGPMGLDPGPVSRAVGVAPVAIQVDAGVVQVDAEIEQLNIVDGVMQDPTGPWVVSWYQETGGLGQVGNLVAAGHINYWGVGDAVFANIQQLTEGDQITFTGEDEQRYSYTVQWTELVTVADLDTDSLLELVGPTEAENVTLLTCGGEFDYTTGEYLSRTVVRAERVDAPAGEDEGE